MYEVVVYAVEGDDVTEQTIIDPKKLEEAVDADLDAFDEYFQRELKNEPLIRSERAILKTYLHYKTHLQRKTHQERDHAG